MNWLKRLLHLEEQEPVEKPEPEPPILELCPICGRRPKAKYVVRDITVDRHYWLEKSRVAALGVVRSRRNHQLVRPVI